MGKCRNSILLRGVLQEFLALDRQRGPSFPTLSYPLDTLASLYVQVTGGSLNETEARILLKRGARQLDPIGDKWTFTRDVAVRNHGLFRFSHDAILSILPNIRCKLLLFKAKDSDWVEPLKLCEDTMSIYKKNCKSYEYIEVPGNHFVPLTNPTAIASHINQFLSSK